MRAHVRHAYPGKRENYWIEDLTMAKFESLAKKYHDPFVHMGNLIVCYVDKEWNNEMNQYEQCNPYWEITIYDDWIEQKGYLWTITH